MPLSKNITDSKGVTATYWAATRGDINLSDNTTINGQTVTGTTWFVMHGYVDKAHHDADIHSFVSELPFTVAIDPSAPLPLPSAGLLANVVGYLEQLALQQSEFAGATVVA